MPANEGVRLNLENMLVRDEDRVHKVYLDTLGNPTVGVGHTGPDVVMGDVWTDERIDAAFATDVADATKDCCARLPWFGDIDEVRRAVLIAMCFQMGIKRLLGFAHMLMYCKQGYYAGAAQEMQQSVWARQTPRRCARLAEQMLTGRWI